MEKAEPAIVRSERIVWERQPTHWFADTLLKYIIAKLADLCGLSVVVESAFFEPAMQQDSAWHVLVPAASDPVAIPMSRHSVHRIVHFEDGDVVQDHDGSLG
eukprot:TRINITY_DN26660_c0_g1_i3.p3 TRINITY_DN26660_c0_g1~~TRINITY_DN26660_c0_g1_i3.p3  ORF type:complete len:102 (-),score=11.60 TRINITY_DN26660_c0_g1_i3:513-818(-)